MFTCEIPFTKQETATDGNQRRTRGVSKDVLERSHDGPFSVVGFREDQRSRAIKYLEQNRSREDTILTGTHLVVDLVLFPR